MFLFLLFLIIIVAIISFKVYLKLSTGICKSSKHLVGKVVIVTGANAGIGYETAKDLAERGARVILACRSEARGTAARDKIIAASGNNDIHYRELDLSSLASVRAFADTIIKTEKRLDVLINNAGILLSNDEKTEDGSKPIMQVNHFGPFLLTSILLPLLKCSAPSRIVTVSSMIYSLGKLDFDKLQDINTYSTSKLCNVLMTVELAERLKGTGVTANCLHPGAVLTDIVPSGTSVMSTYTLYPLRLFYWFAKSAWEGAQTSIYLAVSPEVEGISGKYFVDCKEKKMSDQVKDKKLVRKLWAVSESLVGIEST